ncbi:Hypothetical Protein FCC1311_092882 [Hondaea fermentalgiana]|uniref:Uncharacterized protein n=1 Tax=Hondaea fermentalgiana TaxID=2315210 RepID=A0A2R5GYK2_9STRA|nr:Hypothetical Protein FCC1311_092882 [Hondaea fermentalgiana]|eukprot:GBG33064.1 Hypothetical Protein FCC1311_092882 [Hondaea fermentalgiana]
MQCSAVQCSAMQCNANGKATRYLRTRKNSSRLVSSRLVSASPPPLLHPEDEEEFHPSGHGVGQSALRFDSMRDRMITSLPAGNPHQAAAS